MFQGDLHRSAGSQRSVGHRLLEELLVVIGGGDVALQQDVGMSIDQTGEQRHVAEVDRMRVGRDGAADRLDVAAADHDQSGRNDISAAPVDHASGAKGNDILGGECWTCDERENEQTFHGPRF